MKPLTQRDDENALALIEEMVSASKLVHDEWQQGAWYGNPVKYAEIVKNAESLKGSAEKLIALLKKVVD